MKDNIKAGSDIHAGDGGYSIGTKEKYDEFVKDRNQSLGKARIKKLLDQATMDALYETQDAVDLLDNPVTRQQRELQLEKFAQLIVKECVGLFPNVYVEIENEYGRSPVIAADYIKKHFGVEELLKLYWHFCLYFLCFILGLKVTEICLERTSGH